MVRKMKMCVKTIYKNELNINVLMTHGIQMIYNLQILHEKNVGEKNTKLNTAC